MGDPVITNVDLGNVILKYALFEDNPLTFAGAGTVLEGSILARQLVDAAIVVTPDGANTGDGVVTSSVVGVTETPEPGNWNLECTFAVAEGGVFKLEDPSGNIRANNLTLRVGAGLVTTFNVAGLEIVVTEDTDYVAGDKYELAVVANDKLVPFLVGGPAGSGQPRAVLTYPVTAAGAGDEQIRAMVSGAVRMERLIIDADGDGSNVTKAILDELRNYKIVAVPVHELGNLDNQ